MNLSVFQVDITSRRRANSKLENRCCGYNALVGIGNSDGTGHCTESAPLTLRLDFDNCGRRSRRGLVGATKEQIVQLINFSRQFPNGKDVLVHSGDGRCRGAAVAMAMYAANYLGSEQAVRKVMSECREAAPTEHILHLCDNICGTSLVKEYRKYAQEKKTS